ncbi:MAG: Rrf2 family transcriptional regulator [Pseudomonadota bacterium]
MKLSTKGRYAVTALADIALQSASAEPEADRRLIPLAEISGRQDISLAYLEQLFARLRKAKLVKSVRGPGGGYRLARGADQIRISEIMSAVDETLQAGADCGDEVGAGCAGSRAACLTHDLWERLSAQVYLLLHEITLADVIDKKVTACNALPNFAAALEEVGAKRPLGSV